MFSCKAECDSVLAEWGEVDYSLGYHLCEPIGSIVMSNDPTDLECEWCECHWCMSGDSVYLSKILSVATWGETENIGVELVLTRCMTDG